MPNQNTTELKEKILTFIRLKGPSLPVHIAKEIGMDILFTSAFLSELLSEKKVKMSNMKIGSSSLHFIQGQEPKLKNFSQYLKSKEKDAFQLLQQNKFLYDKEQEPAIRVALREIKDFAIPFKKDDKIIWRYFTIPESEFKQEQEPEKANIKEPKQEPVSLPQENPEKKEEIQKPEQKVEQASEKKLNIFDKKEKPKKKTTKKKTSSSKKKNEKFFNNIKEFLSKKQIDILDIEGFSKNEILLKVSRNQQEYLLLAFNKKRISETDIIKASKKAKELNLSYKIISFGEPPKKTINLIEALKNLSSIEKIE